MCTINNSAHTKKSGNLFNDPRIPMNLKKRIDELKIRGKLETIQKSALLNSASALRMIRFVWFVLVV